MKKSATLSVPAFQPVTVGFRSRGSAKNVNVITVE
jgi:hypothetical protein